VTTRQIPLGEARVGDNVGVVGHRVADTPRSGEIVEVVAGSPHPSLRVKWEDGHVSLLVPSSDVVVSREVDDR
jgi:hypothetical protein